MNEKSFDVFVVCWYMKLINCKEYTIVHTTLWFTRNPWAFEMYFLRKGELGIRFVVGIRFVRID